MAVQRKAVSFEPTRAASFNSRILAFSGFAINNRCAIPIILRFIGNQLSQLEDFQVYVNAFINGIPATGGEIDTYYDYLWQGLPGYHHSGTEGAPHKVLKTLATRKPGFVLTEQRLREVIPRTVVSETDYSEALNQVTALVDWALLAKG
ncbi:MAG: hypothetical protein DRP47_10145 [Candidatus Zixiibacteriota bacterium]|nr:MAG: hypothetical protein DRP47_10145 [candidate division Zixibacteria bacterium]